MTIFSRKRNGVSSRAALTIDDRSIFVRRRCVLHTIDMRCETFIRNADHCRCMSCHSLSIATFYRIGIMSTSFVLSPNMAIFSMNSSIQWFVFFPFLSTYLQSYSVENLYLYYDTKEQWPSVYRTNKVKGYCSLPTA